ncbi:hypothetical protein [Thermoactinospora rubra]|uniref:hypothetical protein n=1 Tax=Thermoactinospora rubra TaxID=1088767 RepID=UPI000A11FEBB|nr:hypothetical protein [Thermoactinospora rubra]
MEAFIRARRMCAGETPAERLRGVELMRTVPEDCRGRAVLVLRYLAASETDPALLRAIDRALAACGEVEHVGR